MAAEKNGRASELQQELEGRRPMASDRSRPGPALFGSHAMGTAKRASDVDLAFELNTVPRDRWAAFMVDAMDEVPALVDLDLIDLGDCDSRLAQEITATGRLVYQRRA